MFGATWASWLGGNQRLQLISATDIGSFARVVFDDPEAWKNKVLPIAGDEKTLNDVDFIFMKQFGSAMPRTFGWMGSLFTAYNKDMGVSPFNLGVDVFADCWLAEHVQVLQGCGLPC